jgi:hypothetical protein
MSSWSGGAVPRGSQPCRSARRSRSRHARAGTANSPQGARVYPMLHSCRLPQRQRSSTCELFLVCLVRQGGSRRRRRGRGVVTYHLVCWERRSCLIEPAKSNRSQWWLAYLAACRVIAPAWKGHTCASLTVRGAPGRGSSSSPSSRLATNRVRHFPTVCFVTRSSRHTRE